MGYYIDPVEGTKEQWLHTHGTLITKDQAFILFNDKDTPLIPVVLVDNSLFTAAGIAFDKEELECFTDASDKRPKRFFAVSKKDVIAVCPRVAKHLL